MTKFSKRQFLFFSRVAVMAGLIGCSGGADDYVGYWRSDNQELFIREDGDLLRFDFKGGLLAGVYMTCSPG